MAWRLWLQLSNRPEASCAQPGRIAILTRGSLTSSPFRHGDAFAWRAFYRRYRKFVQGSLATLGVRFDELEDVCQDVFLSVHIGLSGYRGASQLST